MIADRIIAFLDGLSSEELDKLPPAHRQKFAALCHHWWQLAERPPKSTERRDGVLSRLKSGERSELCGALFQQIRNRAYSSVCWGAADEPRYAHATGVGRRS
jgi:hypothetical protein